MGIFWEVMAPSSLLKEINQSNGRKKQKGKWDMRNFLASDCLSLGKSVPPPSKAPLF